MGNLVRVVMKLGAAIFLIGAGAKLGKDGVNNGKSLKVNKK